MATNARWMPVFVGDLDERITLSTASQTVPTAPCIAAIDPGQTCDMVYLTRYVEGRETRKELLTI